MMMNEEMRGSKDEVEEERQREKKGRRFIRDDMRSNTNKVDRGDYSAKGFKTEVGEIVK